MAQTYDRRGAGNGVGWLRDESRAISTGEGGQRIVVVAGMRALAR